jgi:hypothetical protein
MIKSFSFKLMGAIMMFWLVPAVILAQPTPEEILESIDKGATWLANQQNSDGSWGSGELVAKTGFALTKLCDYAKEHNELPADQPVIMAGLDYLFSMAKTHGPGKGITVIANSGLCDHHETYNAAVALMAFAAFGDPDYVITHPNPVVNGLTIRQLMTEMVSYFTWSQHPQGGWSYEPCNPAWYSSDNSHTGYVVIALRYAEEAGITIPASLKANLSSFIDLIQDDITGESYYTPTWSWPNALKQGNLLLEMSFVGDDLTTQRVQAALNYLSQIWDEPTTDIYGKGWKDPQAMYCLMKGFVSLADGIETIEVAGVDRDWFAEFSEYLLSNQLADGSWDWSFWAEPVNKKNLSTAWALLVLEKFAPPPPLVMVDLDIHPMSWPNPIQLKSKGVTPVAILGTVKLDVSEIDVSTLLLEGVAPVNWYIEDVTAPGSSDGTCNDIYMEPDGILDLTLKFNTQQLLAAIGPVYPGDELVLKLTGKMIDGRNLEGDDCILIVNSNKKNAEAAGVLSEYSLLQNYPNPFNTSTCINYQLPEKSHVTLKVFNLLGQEVETLVNQQQQAGNYSIEWDGRNLKSGTYLYRMIASDFVETKTVVINR